MWKRLFGKSDKEEDAQDNSLEVRIKNAIQKCETDKREAESDIKKLRGWAAEAIIDAYADFFPNANLSYYRDKYKETALANYEKTKTEYGAKLGSEMVEKCDKIVAGYLNRALMLESKLKLVDKLYNEQLTLQKKLEGATQRAAKDNKLDKHADRLKSLDDDVTGLSDTYSE